MCLANYYVLTALHNLIIIHTFHQSYDFFLFEHRYCPYKEKVYLMIRIPLVSNEFVVNEGVSMDKPMIIKIIRWISSKFKYAKPNYLYEKIKSIPHLHRILLLCLKTSYFFLSPRFEGV